MSLNESIVEDAALEWFGELCSAVENGPHLAPREPAAEWDSFSVHAHLFCKTLNLLLPRPPGFFLLVGGGAGFEGDQVVGGAVGGVVAVGGFGDDGFNSGVV